MSLGKRIQYYRKLNHFTQEELAVKLSVSRQAVSRWESGTNEPDVKTLITLSELFDITVDELVKDVEKETENLLDEDTQDVSKENNNDDETIIQNQEKILKAHKRNHRLLMFITTFIVVVFIVPVICSIITSISTPQPYVEPNEMESLYNQIQDSQLIESFDVDVQILSLEEQKILFKPEINVLGSQQTNIEMTIIYQDQTKEKIELSLLKDTVAGVFTGEKVIPAKNISQFIVKAGDQEETFTDVDFPIVEYMYGFNITSTVIDTETDDSFGLKLNIGRYNDLHYDELFESTIRIINPEFSQSEFTKNMDVCVEVYRDYDIYSEEDDELIFTENIKMKDIGKEFEIPFKHNVDFEVKCKAKTPLGVEIKTQLGT